MSTSASLTDILLREGLRLNGISEKDVTIIPVGDLGARLSGLQTGRIHGAIIAATSTRGEIDALLTITHRFGTC